MTDTRHGDIAKALLELERDKKTGVLEFRAEGVLTRVFVDDGIPVLAEAGVLGETLGHVLVREQIITNDQFAAVVRKVTDAIVDDDNENVRFGEVLVELGFLTQQDVTNALATQSEKKIIGCVTRGVGEWSFEESRDVKHATRHGTPIRGLLVDAAALLPAQRVESVLALDTDTFPCTLETAAKLAEDYGLDEREVVALNQLDGTRSTKSVLDATSDVEMHALLVALVMGGGVELLSKKGAKTPPAATRPVTVSGRHRAIRIKMVADDKPKVAPESLRPRAQSLRPARNDREATLFAEDEFQSGKRLFGEGKFAEAHAQLVLACERSPHIQLYRLYEQFVGSRAQRGFADLAETKALAIQMVKEDAECAFAHYVLGYVALEEASQDAAKRFFTHAFRLDPQLLDAGRQARLLDKRQDRTRTSAPTTPFRDVVPMRRAVAASKAGPSNTRLRMLVTLLVVILVGGGAYLWFVHAGTFADYEEVR